MFAKTVSLFAVAAALLTIPAQADTLSEWASIQSPPVPSVGPVTVDRATTALLLLDFNTPPCDPAENPRCQATLPAVKALLDRARTTGMLVIYTLGGSTAADSIAPVLKPRPDDKIIAARPDKFLSSDLDNVLKAHGIKTLITTGTTANGAVLYTASEAAFRGYTVVVPVDGIPGLTPVCGADDLVATRERTSPRW